MTTTVRRCFFFFCPFCFRCPSWKIFQRFVNRILLASSDSFIYQVLSVLNHCVIRNFPSIPSGILLFILFTDNSKRDSDEMTPETAVFWRKIQTFDVSNYRNYCSPSLLYYGLNIPTVILKKKWAILTLSSSFYSCA